MKNKPDKVLKTRWAEVLEKTPWSEYPRPQLRRNSYLNLNGEWDFAVRCDGAIPRSYPEKITVPFPPESILSGIGRITERSDTLYYRRIFTLPEGFISDRVILHFGAVDQIAKLYINGSEVGSHEGGYIPFSFDITDFLSEGENEIILSVRDALDKIYPYGKQKYKRGGMWYTPVSGIWQSVWLESLPVRPIRGIQIDGNDEYVKIKVYSEAENKVLTLKSTGEVFEFDGDEIVIRPKERYPWSPEAPYLYEFTLKTDTDEVESYFALRKISVERVGGIARLCLNGRPYLFNGLLDQGYFPDGIFTPPSPLAYEYDIMLAKRLGFNTLRKHIKIEPLIFYHLCDKLGIVVFQDMVNNSSYSFLFDTAFPTVGINRQVKKHKDKRSREVFKKQMLETLELLYNSPSVLQYTVFNEGWGQFLPDENYALAKAHAGDRVIDATSGWFYGKDSDFNSKHIYFKPLKVENDGERPLFISEFGGYSLRVDDHAFGKGNYGYRRFTDKEAFTEAVERLYLDEALPLIDCGLSALVFTQLSDVEDETNGLVTYDRAVEKADSKRIREINERLYERLDEIYFKSKKSGN